MRIYEGSPRQDFEEVLRSIGAFLDQRGMREVLLAEAPDGFIVQGLVVSQAGSGGWSESVGAMSVSGAISAEEAKRMPLEDLLGRLSPLP